MAASRALGAGSWVLGAGLELRREAGFLLPPSPWAGVGVGGAAAGLQRRRLRSERLVHLPPGLAPEPGDCRAPRPVSAGTTSPPSSPPS